MKKIISLVLALSLCFALCSCGAATLSGDMTAFKNADNSFSIMLPAEETEDKDKASWIINEETSGDVLDMTDSGETVRVVVQAMAKTKAARVAADFEGYKTYVVETAFADLIKGAKMKDTTMEVPEFVTNSSASTYTADKTEGVIVFMETAKAYYAYLVVAAEGGYDANDKILEESILSLVENPAEEAPADEKKSE